MGYHPETLAFSFPPYPRGGVSLTAKDGTRERRRFSFGGLLYSLEPWIGIDVWHIDPERHDAGQRSDDSCGWFDRRPQEYGYAVDWLLKDKDVMHDVERCIRLRHPVTAPYGHTYPRMSPADALAACLMVAHHLELRRWWNGTDGNNGACNVWWRKLLFRKRNVDPIAADLALNPIDNLSFEDDPERLVRLIAGALHRRFKPWWKHPRWHVHHWKVNFSVARNLRRMFQRCAGCGNRLGFGHCPTSSGDKMYHSHGCAYSQGPGASPNLPAEMECR